MSWDLKVLIEISYLEPYLSSLNKRQKFARYHFKEFNRLLSCPLKILNNDDEVYQAEAHIFALMQCMHGLIDTLAHVNLVILITKLICDDNYKYLEAFVNHSRHRSLIGITYLFENVEPEFLFNKFSHKKIDFVQKPIKEYIDIEYARQSQLVVKIGNKINEFVK